jgi:hypothetical protein
MVSVGIVGGRVRGHYVDVIMRSFLESPFAAATPFSDEMIGAKIHGRRMDIVMQFFQKGRQRPRGIG